MSEATTQEELHERIQKAANCLKEAGAREVYVFGSVAARRMSNNSDVDMAVSGLLPEKFFAAAGKAADCIGRPLDLIDLDEITPFTQYLKGERVLKRVL